MSLHYNSGLVVQSEIPLTGVADAPPDSHPDITIRLGAVPLHLPNAERHSDEFEVSAEAFLLSISGIARCLLTGGSNVTVDLLPDASLEDVAIFLTGTIPGILLHQRGRTVLHASAVRVHGRAVLFCGPSRAGKSTMAAALARRGYDILNDDLCAADVSPSGAVVTWPDSRLLKLWEPAIRQLEMTKLQGRPVCSRVGKYYVTAGRRSPAPTAPVPIGAIYELRESNLTETPRLTPLDSVLAIRRNAYRPALVGFMGHHQRYLDLAARLTSQVGIFALGRPLNLADLDGVVDHLEQHWQRTGVAGTMADATR